MATFEVFAEIITVAFIAFLLYALFRIVRRDIRSYQTTRKEDPAESVSRSCRSVMGELYGEDKKDEDGDGRNEPN